MRLISYKLDDNEAIGSLELDEIVPFKRNVYSTILKEFKDIF